MTNISDTFTFDILRDHLATLGTGKEDPGEFGDGMVAVRGVGDVLKAEPERALAVIELLAPQLRRPSAWITRQVWGYVLYNTQGLAQGERQEIYDRFMMLATEGRSQVEATKIMTTIAMGQAGGFDLVESMNPSLAFLAKHHGLMAAQRAAQHLGYWVMRKSLGLGHEFVPKGSQEVFHNFLGYVDLKLPLLPSEGEEVQMSWEEVLTETLMEADEYGYASDEEQNRWVITRLAQEGLDINTCVRHVLEYGRGLDYGGYDTGRLVEVLGWFLEAGAQWDLIQPQLTTEDREVMESHPVVMNERLGAVAAQSRTTRSKGPDKRTL